MAALLLQNYSKWQLVNKGNKSVVHLQIMFLKIDEKQSKCKSSHYCIHHFGNWLLKYLTYLFVTDILYYLYNCPNFSLLKIQRCIWFVIQFTALNCKESKLLFSDAPVLQLSLGVGLDLENVVENSDIYLECQVV